MVARALAIHLEATDDPGLAGNRMALVVAVAATAAALCIAAWPAARILQARRAVARIVRRLGDDVRGVGAVQETLAVATGNASLRVAYPRGVDWIDARGEQVPAPEPGASEVRVAGETIATISGLTDAGALSPAVQLGIANERLRAGVLAEIADLRSSRERIVEAGDAERRTLERNLHDGAQQGLVALSFALRRARTQASSRQAAELDRALEQTDRALAELREVAHGIFPGLLAEAGLETALHALADSSAASVLVTCSLLERPAPEVEMAAYRVAAEAVERAVLAADGRDLEISIMLDRGLRVRVVGEHGGGAAADTDGLADAADRVTALGGTITVRQPAPSTTVLEALIPCAS
jgi:signal transduction histidine kinase